MWLAIGLATTRQLRLAGAHCAHGAGRLAAKLTHRTAVTQSVLRRGGAVVPHRGFAATQARPASSAEATTEKPTKAKSRGASKGAAATKKPKKLAKKPKKKPAKKPAKKARLGRPPKVLTDEEKQKLQIRELKKVALLREEPKKLPIGSWRIFVSEALQPVSAEVGDSRTQLLKLGESYKNLTRTELDRLVATSEQNKLANDAALRSWVESKTVDEIVAANNARKYLKRLGKNVPHLIKDIRQPRRPSTAFMLFLKSRYQSGDMPKLQASELMAKIAAEWKALRDAERQPYLDNAEIDRARYHREQDDLNKKS